MLYNAFLRSKLGVKKSASEVFSNALRIRIFNLNLYTIFSDVPLPIY